YMVSFLRSIRDKQEKGNHTLLSINLAAVHSLSLIHGFLYSRNLVKQIVNALCVLSDASHVLFSSYEYQLVFFIKNPAGPDYVLSFARLVSKKVASFLREERVGWGIGIVAFDDSPLEVCLTNLLVASEKGFAGFDEGQEICMYGEAMQEEVRRRTVLEQELAAFVKEEPLGTSTFYLQFQPIWDVKTHMITGFEALSRMYSHSLGTVSPVEFIEIAEKAKLIVPLGNVIIAKALYFLSALEREGFVHVGVSINISAIQLMHKDFMRDLMVAIERIQVNTANITLEVTESVFISEFQQVNDLFFQLQEKGISISLDDFGTGYSTLSRERELNVNCLKIDKTFIDKLTTLHEKEAITADIISMAHKLGHTVIAEGVEYEEQRAYLEKYGCDKIQGFLYNKPLDLDAALLLLKQTNQTENR
ncbi:MAG: EAL domain-containing protein, partial [Sphaerochaetaceae bacterium]